MKVKEVKISVRSLRETLIEFADAYEKLSKGERVSPKYSLSFASPDGYRRLMTPRRLELLLAIKEKAPNSVYELAHIVKRDLKSVNTDLKILEKYDLVSLEKSTEGRERVRPEVDFDRLKIDIAFA